MAKSCAGNAWQWDCQGGGGGGTGVGGCLPEDTESLVGYGVGEALHPATLHHTSDWTNQTSSCQSCDTRLWFNTRPSFKNGIRWDWLLLLFLCLQAAHSICALLNTALMDFFFFQHILVKRTERSFGFGTLPDEENKIQNCVFNAF